MLSVIAEVWTVLGDHSGNCYGLGSRGRTEGQDDFGEYRMKSGGMSGQPVCPGQREQQEA